MEPEKLEEIESHPLYSLYKAITEEQKATNQRQEDNDFKDPNENNFAAFLEEEAKPRVVLAIKNAIYLEGNVVSYKPKPMESPERAKYEQKWEEFLKESDKTPGLDKDEANTKIDTLFDLWNSLPKAPLV